MKEINLNELTKTFVIAEVGINHNGDIEKAKDLINAAAESGYDAVKFQTYKSETRIPDIKHDLYKILKKFELKYSDFEILKEHCEKNAINFMSTVFHVDDFNYLKTIGTNIYKISSFDLTNYVLINEVSKSGKTIIISTGMGDISEIDKAYEILKKNSNDFSILHCISSYPLLEENSNLKAINTLSKRYKCPIGYSDHTNDIISPLYSIAVGSKILEKHFKIDDDCIDAKVSIDKKDSKKMITEIRRLEKILGDGKKECKDSEKSTKIFRKHSNI